MDGFKVLFSVRCCKIMTADDLLLLIFVILLGVIYLFVLASFFRWERYFQVVEIDHLCFLCTGSVRLIPQYFVSWNLLYDNLVQKFLVERRPLQRPTMTLDVQQKTLFASEALVSYFFDHIFVF